jgi:hypothetical protein
MRYSIAVPQIPTIQKVGKRRIPVAALYILIVFFFSMLTRIYQLSAAAMSYDIEWKHQNIRFATYFA